MIAKRTRRWDSDGQRSADFFVRYTIVEADRQGVTGPLTTNPTMVLKTTS